MPDTGVCTISGYNWDFGDGETDVGSSIPTNHTYASPGTYVITLEVTNQGGALTAVRSVTVPFVAPTPSPSPTGSPTPTPGPTATATPSPSPTPTVAPCAAPVADFTWTTRQPAPERDLHGHLHGTGGLPDHQLAVGVPGHDPVDVHQRPEPVPRVPEQ